MLIDVIGTRGIHIVKEGDIVVITHVVVSRAEGRTVDLRQVKPSKVAENLAAFTGKGPRLVEVVLQNSRAVRRMRTGLLVAKN